MTTDTEGFVTNPAPTAPASDWLSPLAVNDPGSYAAAHEEADNEYPAVIYTERRFTPFYRKWKWRRPLWSLNPFLWWVIEKSPGYSDEEGYYCTADEATVAMAERVHRRWAGR